MEETIYLSAAGTELLWDAGSPASFKVKQGGCESGGWTSGVFVEGEGVTKPWEALHLFSIYDNTNILVDLLSTNDFSYSWADDIR